MTPRCGKPMWRYIINRQRAQSYAIDQPVCGRPEGHAPPCRTEEAVRFANQQATERYRSARAAGVTRADARRSRR